MYRKIIFIFVYIKIIVINLYEIFPSVKNISDSNNDKGIMTCKIIKRKRKERVEIFTN